MIQPLDTDTLSRGDQVQYVLDDFIIRTPEALVALAASKEGLSIASATSNTAASEEDALAVAAAKIVDMAAEVNNQLEQGSIGRILIEGSKHTNVVVSAGRDIVLIVTLPADAKLGLAMHTVRNAADHIAQIYN